MNAFVYICFDWRKLIGNQKRRKESSMPFCYSKGFDQPVGLCFVCLQKVSSFFQLYTIVKFFNGCLCKKQCFMNYNMSRPSISRNINMIQKKFDADESRVHQCWKYIGKGNFNLFHQKSISYCSLVLFKDKNS